MVTPVVSSVQAGGDQAVVVAARAQGEGIRPGMAARVFTVDRVPCGGAEFRFTLPAGAPVR
jgi:hypothetical protein